jgi:hypothetical protein
MGLNHIASSIQQDNYRIVQHQTWGHLFPKPKSVFIGFIRIALTDYGDLIVLKDASNVPASPWWFSSLMEYTGKFLMEMNSPGIVFEIQTHCSIKRNKDKSQQIEISNMGYKIILE